MLYVFKSKADVADVMMLQDLASTLMQIIGRELTPRGVFTPEQMGDAIARLEAAISREAAGGEGGDGAEAADPDRPEPLRLKQRAFPLLKLLRASQANDVPVTWGV